MALLKKKIKFTDLCSLALIQWDEGFYIDREGLTKLANRSIQFELTQEQIDKLWARFEQFYLVEIYLYSFAQFKGKYEPKELSKTIYTVYLSYLMQQRGMSREEGLDYIAKNKLQYADDILEDTMNQAVVNGIDNFKGENLADVLNSAVREFCTSFHFYDVPNETTDQFKDGMFDSEMIAFKLVRPSILVLRALFNEHRIIWDQLPDSASSNL